MRVSIYVRQLFFLPLMLFVFRRVVLNYLGLSFCPGFGAISTNKLAKHM